MRPLVFASLLSALTTSAWAEAPTAAPPDLPPATSAPPPAVTLVRPAPPPLKNHFLTYASFAFNAYTYLGATASAPEAQLTPASRGILYQQVGIGYFFHPLVRLQLTLQLGETVSGLPPGSSPFTVLGLIPWLVFSTHGFFTGAGVALAPISYGKVPNFDAGIYTATGYAVQLGRGFSLPIGLQVVLMLNQRVSLALTPAVALAYRF
jgi:hypothetical protein